MHGTVSLYVEDLVYMTHGAVDNYFIDMGTVSSSEYTGDMKAKFIHSFIHSLDTNTNELFVNELRYC